MFDLKARGSEPPAQIRWYLGESPLDNFKIEVYKNKYIYLSKLVFLINNNKFQHNPLGSTTKSILIFEPGKTILLPVNQFT